MFLLLWMDGIYCVENETWNLLSKSDQDLIQGWEEQVEGTSKKKKMSCTLVGVAR